MQNFPRKKLAIHTPSASVMSFEKFSGVELHTPSASVMSFEKFSGVEQGTINRKVVGSNPT